MSAPLIADLTDEVALRQALTEQLRVGALEVRTSLSVPLLTPLTVLVLLTEGRTFSLTGRAVAPMPRGDGFFVQLDPTEALEELRRVQVPDAAPEAPPEPEEPLAQEMESEEEESPSESEQESLEKELPPGTKMPTPAWKLIDATSTVPIHKQLKELGVSDRVRLARQATRPVRALLLRDIEKRIHLEVVKNPKITDEEIVEATKISNLSPGALRYIATQRKYTRRRDVVLNLIYNPSTPSDQSMKLIGTLNQSELLKIMRSNRVREKLQIAAKKKLMKAGII
mgnify:CR=1 FL=1